jgi:hypothetical protein
VRVLLTNLSALCKVPVFPVNSRIFALRPMMLQLRETLLSQGQAHVNALLWSLWGNPESRVLINRSGASSHRDAGEPGPDHHCRAWNAEILNNLINIFCCIQHLAKRISRLNYRSAFVLAVVAHWQEFCGQRVNPPSQFPQTRHEDPKGRKPTPTFFVIHGTVSH